MDRQILLLVAALVLGAGALAWAFLSGNPAEARARAIAKGAGKVSAARPGKPESRKRRQRIEEVLARADAQGSAAAAQKPKASLAMRIERAGLDIEVRTFYIASVILGIVFFGVGLALGFVGQWLPVAGLLAIFGGIGVPRFVIGFLFGVRKKKFLDEFANTLDVIVRGVRSGIPVNECLKIIARDAPSPVREEFELINESLRIGVPLDEALERMAERMPIPETRFFAIVVAIQKKTGGNLGEALANLAGVLRGRKTIKLKIGALTAEVTASAFVIGGLPFAIFGLISVMQPGYFDPMIESMIGQVLFGVCAVLMITGGTILYKMIQIKV